jgi:integral membrane sensor domain MASE1
VQNDLTHPDAVAAHGIRWPARLKPIAVAALMLAVYVALEWISFIHEYKGLPVTPWNPGLGVIFALMLIAGRRYVVVLFLGVLVAELVVLRTNLSLPIVVGIAAITATGYGAIAAAIRPKLDVGLNHLPDVLMLLAAGAVGAFVVALLLSLLLIADAQLDLSDVLVASGPLLVGDVIGIAVMTPLTLRFVLRARYPWAWQLRALAPEVALYVSVVVLILWLVGLTESESGFRLFYLFFLPVVIAAIRYGLDGSCLGLALTQLGLVGLMHRHGYDANVFTEFQVLMLVLTATGLTVGVTVSERRQANRTIRDVEARLRAREAEATQAARFNLASGMASALAHEINQPITAARALGRAAQEILRAQQPDHHRADNKIGRAS